MSRVKRFVLVGITLVLAACTFLVSDGIRWPSRRSLPMSGAEESSKADGQFDWESISPSRELEYHPCNGHFHCARLELPMDWTADESHQWDHTVAIAIIKLSANVSTLDSRYGGEIYTNPGGPGGSGTGYVRRAGESLSKLINGGAAESSESKLFDIVGFDPRGIMHSTPRPRCFPDLMSRQLWFQMTDAYGPVTDSEATAARRLARTAALAKMCDPGNSTAGHQLLKRHMSTTSVARDLLAMIDRSAELREKSERKLTGEQPPPPSAGKGDEPSKPMLQYWGFSYGTTLGGYFASMYPDRVGRLVLDSNSNFERWAAGDSMSFLNQTDESVRTVLKACHAAGRDKCPLYEEGGAGAMDNTLRRRLADLKKAPLPIWSEGMRIPEVLTYQSVVSAMFHALFVPYSAFPQLAEQLAALINGTADSPALLRRFLPNRGLSCTDDQCGQPQCLDRAELHPEGGQAVLGSDYPANRTLEDFRRHAAGLPEQSALFGEMFATDVAASWNAWPVAPAWRFGGPFGGPTRHPILFVGNTGDPVSPARNGADMARIFGGAVALTQDSVGHCSPSAPSVCTVRHVREYFQSGALPAEGTVCEVDWLPFQDPPDLAGLAGEDLELRRAVVDVMASGGVAPGFFGGGQTW